MLKKLIVGLVLTTVLQIQAGTFYVDASRPDDSGLATSWINAKKTIQAAIDISAIGDQIMVTNGIYGPISTDNKAVIIQSVEGANVTIIDGGSGNRCAMLGNAGVSYTNTVLIGFTLRNGYASGGGGGSRGGTLNNCILSNNLAFASPNSYSHGGGAYYGTLNNCTLTDNRVSANNYDCDGGGASQCTLNNCILSNNKAVKSSYGGGASYCKLNNCKLTGNNADKGGGSYYGTLNNCDLSGNNADKGGGSYYGTLNNCSLSGNNANGSCGGSLGSTLKNCTITRNTALSVGGIGGDASALNCIIFDNTAHNHANYDETGYIIYSCTYPLLTGAGNIAAEPLFSDPNRGNFRLAMNSPCINAGSNALAVGETDLDGNERIIGGNVDIGAYEALPVAMVLNSSNLVWTSGGDACWYGQPFVTADGDEAMQSGLIGDAQSVWIQAVTEGKGTLRFAWMVSSESRDYLRFYADDQPASAISGDSGWQTFSLAITNAGVHTFRWVYVKGKSGAAGADAGWLDQVVWTPATVTVDAVCSPGEGGTVIGGGVCVAGSAITLVAVPNRGWRFVRWENDDTHTRRVLTVPDGGASFAAFFVEAAIPLAEALDTETLTWSTNGDAFWNGWVLASAHDGADAAQSGTIGDLDVSRVGTMLTGPGTFSFWWRVSCEEDCDYLDFALDGLTVGWLTGESGWQYVTLNVGEGQHSLEWEYWKDESLAEGEDAAWLDLVTWIPDTPPLSGFALWADGKGLTGDLAAILGEDHDTDGVANVFEYAYGTNFMAGVPLLNIRMIGGRPVLETLLRDPNSTNDVEVAVQGCTNLYLGGWTLPVGPAVDTAGKPEGREWFEPQGEVIDKAFFRLRGVLK